MAVCRWFTAFLLLLVGVGPAAAQQWVEHRPAGAGYRVEFPAAPTVEVEDVPSDYGPMKTTTAELDVKALALMASDTVLPSAAAGASPASILDGFRDGMVRESQCDLRRERRMTIGGATARRLVMDCGGGKAVATAILAIKAGRLYNITAVVVQGEDGDADARRFLDSFALTP
ncbi:hypothetical protein [Reyranella sp.]|uniref:hypothetical protein n=1 Tax=Reyranella sp. TaxID=1929291 RepID=UPI003BAA70DE